MYIFTYKRFVQKDYLKWSEKLRGKGMHIAVSQFYHGDSKFEKKYGMGLIIGLIIGEGRFKKGSDKTLSGTMLMSELEFNI